MNPVDFSLLPSRLRRPSPASSVKRPSPSWRPGRLCLRKLGRLPCKDLPFRTRHLLRFSSPVLLSQVLRPPRPTRIPTYQPHEEGLALAGSRQVTAPYSSPPTNFHRFYPLISLPPTLWISCLQSSVPPLFRPSLPFWSPGPSHSIGCSEDLWAFSRVRSQVIFWTCFSDVSLLRLPVRLDFCPEP